MLQVALLLILSTARAEPGTPPTSASAEPAPAPFKERLEGAKKLYFQGHRREALELLLALQVQFLTDEEDQIPWEHASEALVFLGEVHYFAQDLSKAQQTWRVVLERDPDHPRLSPFAHPPEIAGEFELLRARVKEEIANRPVPEAPPLPAWSILPLGIPQFADGHPARGVMYGLLQVGLASGSIAMYTAIEAKNDNIPLNDPAASGRITAQRYGVQWPLTFGAYGAWAASHIDARRSWKREHAVTTSVSWTGPAQGRVGIVVQGSF